MADPWIVRPARPADAGPLAALEQRCFADPWSQPAFADVIGTPGLLSLVAEEGSAVQGYVIARGIADEGEILNLAVAPEVRRRRLGGHLLDAMLARLRERGIRTVFLEVRESNTAARELYRSRRFEVAGRRARYYRYPVEDAVVLRLALAAPA